MFNLGNKTVGMGLSFPKSKTVCGYEIKKMHLGAWLKAVERLQDLPADIIRSCFPGKTIDGIIGELSSANENSITNILSGILSAAPSYAIGFISELSGIDEDMLLTDPEIGSDGLIDIIFAIVEVNRLGESVRKLKGLIKQIPKLTLNTGSSD